MAMESGTTLILGGARSGKSRHALLLAERSGLAPILIATATAGDSEMAARIERHKADRSDRWRAVEEPIELVGVLETWRDPGRVLVVDCLTLWLSNLMGSGADIEAATRRLIGELGVARGPVILVSNEVGFGIVPANRISRQFRDAQGFLNQAAATACDHVAFIIAGLPLTLKPAP